MKKMTKQLSIVAMLLVLGSFVFTGCDNNDEDPELPNDPTGKSETYTLFEAGSSGTSGTIIFEELLDMSTRITISLTGAGGDHPAHIHDNSAAEGGGIAIDLTIVDASGKSITEVSSLNNGTKITYNELIDFNGYVNVHKSASELGSLIAQGDIGINALTGSSMEFELFEAKVAGISGKVTFKERKNGETLVMIELSGTSAGGDHPAHVHANTAAEGGGILVSLNNVDGATGMSQTNVSKLNDDTPISYSELKDFNGYVQVHNSESDLGTPIARGDIGMNELTGKSEMYPLNAKSNTEISGSAKFEERKSGATLVTIMLNGTMMDDSHPSHIHMNTAAEGGGIEISLTSVDGGAGISYTNVSQKNDETEITYDELIEFNGYINVHNSSMDLGTLIAQGDIGQNALTGTSMTYTLNEQNASGVSGTATFAERNNGYTLITISLMGTMDGGDHPSHIHNGDVDNPGGIAISLNNVNGASGMSMTSVSKMNDETEIKYSDLIGFNGYAQIHDSDANLGLVLTNGNIGSN